MLVFTLPDWQVTAPKNDWLKRWEIDQGYQRIEQHDWRYPRRGDWSARLEETLSDAHGPVVLIAHGLGCVLLSWWVAHSRHVSKVTAALLLNPLDVVNTPEAQTMLSGWAPLQQERLPFRSLLLQDADAIRCSLNQAKAMAQSWGSEFEVVTSPDSVCFPGVEDEGWGAGLMHLRSLLGN